MEISVNTKTVLVLLTHKSEPRVLNGTHKEKPSQCSQCGECFCSVISVIAIRLPIRTIITSYITCNRVFCAIKEISTIIETVSILFRGKTKHHAPKAYHNYAYGMCFNIMQNNKILYERIEPNTAYNCVLKYKCLPTSVVIKPLSCTECDYSNSQYNTFKTLFLSVSRTTHGG